ncbi:GNAT superfamily N-acetyltransferase [Paenibacillus phyllosphaerae]|uniref:GNAT superfamily N-acetyltransferase n=1 Tax=Paenibacillus phyllosphaerae TaxID=274593 RepID=A0A7W5AWF7_9BACL|nr:GNAT family N-acetyltransferase [Paenibacillus phyllosphaerae]MBB3109988.1 GNAT superfamily N-acetyltransferase [Paenibacillus phyllosphaerae]
MISIKPYEEVDLAGVAALMADLGYPSEHEAVARRLGHIQAHDSLHVYVAHASGEVAGLIALRLCWNMEYDNPTAQVALIVTKQSMQGRGIGKALMAFAEGWGRERGAGDMMLTSGNKPERQRAHGMYQHLGYRNNGIRFVKRLK